MKLNKVDNAIYHHFLAKLDANVKRFGYQNMQHEIQDLKYSEDQFSKDCHSVSTRRSIKKKSISAMSKQEMNCGIASGEIRTMDLNDWLRKRQSTQSDPPLFTSVEG